MGIKGRKVLFFCFIPLGLELELEFQLNQNDLYWSRGREEKREGWWEG